MTKDFDAIIANARSLLDKNRSWVSQYKEYGEQLLARRDLIIEKRSLFKEWAPLFYYTNTDHIKKYKTQLVVDVRFRGQNVAVLKCDNKNNVLISTKSRDKSNLANFGYDAPLENVAWSKAEGFRKFFSKNPVRINTNKGNREHNIESLLISEFEKDESANKLIRGIQPVKYARKIRFATPTPLSASNHEELTFSPKGGGIDILTRVGSSGFDVHLCIIEVKDENIDSEKPEDALQQATEYAVFLRELLRSEAGPLWWEIFGFKRQLPLPGDLTLYSACAMPRHESGTDDISFGGKRFDIGGDTIECHYIYYELNEDESAIASIKTSLNQ